MVKPGWIRTKDRYLRKKYGISYAIYEGILFSQENKCYICRRKLKLTGKNTTMTPQVDHCHTTGKVRGILCRVCNFRIVPMFEKNIDRITYLKHYLTKEEHYGIVP